MPISILFSLPFFSSSHSHSHSFLILFPSSFPFLFFSHFRSFLIPIHIPILFSFPFSFCSHSHSHSFLIPILILFPFSSSFPFPFFSHSHSHSDSLYNHDPNFSCSLPFHILKFYPNTKYTVDHVLET